jgi:hypothetical protein
VKFPVDAPKARVVRALKELGFEIVRERETYRDASYESGWHDDAADPSESFLAEKLDIAGHLHASENRARGLPQGLRKVLSARQAANAYELTRFAR